MQKTILRCAGTILFGALALMADTAETIPFLAVMLPGNETPAINDTSSGNAIIWLHVIRDSQGNITSGSVDFDVACKFSSAVTVTGLHIHSAPAGVAGSIVIPTDVNSSDKSIPVDATGRSAVFKQVQFGLGGAPASVATIQDLVANPQNYYANIHTTDHPGGAMRGQLLRAEMRILMGLMSANNEVPPTGVNASGIVTVTMLRALDGSGKVAAAEAIFNLQYTGFDPGTVFTGFHIHGGPAGVNAGVIINSGIGGTNTVAADPSGAGNLNYPIPMSPLDSNFAAEAAAVNGIFANPNDYYINIHTTVFPGGVMRDQLRSTERAVFQVNMLASNETPAIAGLTASGQTAIPIYLLRNPDGSVAAGTVVFDVNFRGFPAGTAITGLHIHQAPAGTAGGIVIPTNVDASANKVSSDTGNGNVYKIVTVSTAAGITALNNLVQNPAGFYANLHTTVNPGGAIRDQLKAPAAKPAITQTGAAASTITSAAPGSVFSVFGSDLAPYTSDLSGFYQQNSLASSMNGVTVTIGGMKAPLYFVSPGQLNIQTPFEVAAGQQQILITTPAGQATANITVANLAPSIFVVDGAGSGAVVKKSDGSLVTKDNAVKSGDMIVIYSTGLGQTTPAVQTGALVQAGPGAAPNTGTVSVTIGSQNATVVSSTAVPNAAGVYVTTVMVPGGVSGAVPLILKSGGASSNSINLMVAQ